MPLGSGTDPSARAKPAFFTMTVDQAGLALFAALVEDERDYSSALDAIKLLVTRDNGSQFCACLKPKYATVVKSVMWGLATGEDVSLHAATRVIKHCLRSESSNVEEVNGDVEEGSDRWATLMRTDDVAERDDHIGAEALSVLALWHKDNTVASMLLGGTHWPALCEQVVDMLNSRRQKAQARLRQCRTIVTLMACIGRSCHGVAGLRRLEHRHVVAIWKVLSMAKDSELDAEFPTAVRALLTMGCVADVPLMLMYITGNMGAANSKLSQLRMCILEDLRIDALKMLADEIGCQD